MRLIRKHHESGGAPIASDRLEQLDGLQWRRAGIGIVRAVHDEERYLDLVGEEERRNLTVHIRGLPYRSPFALEAKRRERLVVGAAGRGARPEQIGVGQKVRGHQRAVTMSRNTNALAIGDAQPHCLIDGCLGIGDELFHVRVVGFFRIADDGKRSVVDDGVTGEQQQPELPQPRKGLLRTGDLARLCGIGVIQRICIEDRRDACALLVAGWRIECER